MTTSSTLVETVSINYEDFTEGFLTCGTCLNTYDNGDHCPKLLNCSHTICRFCLEKICNLPRVAESGSFRCPICREEIPLPNNGVSSFPPSFLVNQLLDLISQQRREVIPKCSNHLTRELLFCETCDCVFCSLCSNGSHVNINNCEHTVIPFSIAIKRMSEILLYKAHLCIAKLNDARENVMNEMRKLDLNSEHAFEEINRTFQEIINIVDRRRQEVLSIAKRMKEEKQSTLENQLNLIETEKAKVESECNGLQYQVDVRNITSKISELNDKMDSIGLLQDPRENCFIRYEHLHNEAVNSIKGAVNSFGSVRTSKTYPPFCVATISECSAKLKASATIITYDFNGIKQNCGEDPVTAELKRLEDGVNVSINVTHNNDGTYTATFVPPKKGKYHLLVSIFGRPIKTYPIEFEASQHINPSLVYGKRGSGDNEFNQPTGITINEKNGDIYVLDTGNGRVKILSETNNLEKKFNVRHIEGLDRSVTGIAFVPDTGNILVTNWRTRMVNEIDGEGKSVRGFVHKDFCEPTHLTFNSKNEIIVADNGAKAVFIFHPSGKLFKKLGGDLPLFGVIGAVGVGENNDIIIADSKIHVYSSNGDFKREIYPEGKLRGIYSGIAYDNKENLLAVRREKNKIFLQVFDYQSGTLKFIIDSHDSKLKRPVSITITNDFHAVVVDLGNDCIKKYRYQ